MKIAQIASVSERVPPKKYGGTERVVYALTEELVKRGHDVTLFASGDSVTSGKLVSVFPRSLREAGVVDPYGLQEQTMHTMGLAYSRAAEFDVIHDHLTPISLPTANISPTPVVATLHGPLTGSNKAIYAGLNKPHLVSISEAQRRPAPNLNFIATVYNGLVLEPYPFSDTHDGYLLFVGRISMEKGVHHAIATARQLGMPLIIAAKVDKVDRSYHKEYVEPYLNEDIRWIGEVDEEERNKLMSRAAAFLHPVTWREPFGLTLIEAMACGAPVIAFGKGSIPEIVMHEKTGFVVDDVDEMVEAVQNLDSVDRATCRTHALENFSASKMADRYEEVYKKAVET